MSSIKIQIDNAGWIPFLFELKRDRDEGRSRKCTRCGGIYFEYENFGSWQCWEHFRPLDEDGRYICCNLPSTSMGNYRSTGCKRADHTSDLDAVSFGTSDDLEMPINCHIQMLKHCEKKKIKLHGDMIYKGKQSTYLIRRAAESQEIPKAIEMLMF